VVPRASGPFFMFCAPTLVFDGTEGVGYHFHVLRNCTHFRRYRGRHVSFSCFALPDFFSALPRASGPFFIFCAPVHVFDGTEGFGSLYHVLRSRTSFRRYRGLRVPLSCFARLYSFSAVPRASGPVFMFCAPELVFGGTEGVRSLFHVLRSRNHFRRYHGSQVPFSCFVLPDSFSVIPWASGPIFMFCSPEIVLRALTHFQRYRGRSIPFSCFALSESFSAVPRASGPIFLFCVPGLFFGGTGGVGSRFHILRFRNRFRRYRGRRVPFSCFARPDSLSAVPRTFHPVFMFSAPRHVFCGKEGVGYRFHVFRSRTRFRRYRGRLVLF
jgi:hypothetical protein